MRTQLHLSASFPMSPKVLHLSSLSMINVPIPQHKYRRTRSRSRFLYLTAVAGLVEAIIVLVQRTLYKISAMLPIESDCGSLTLSIHAWLKAGLQGLWGNGLGMAIAEAMVTAAASIVRKANCILKSCALDERLWSLTWREIMRNRVQMI